VLDDVSTDKYTCKANPLGPIDLVWVENDVEPTE
jgi:hypothetical protein